MECLTLTDIKDTLLWYNSKESKNFVEYYMNDIFGKDGWARNMYQLLPIIIKEDAGSDQFYGKILAIDIETGEPKYATQDFYEWENLFFLIIFLLQDEGLLPYFNDTKENIMIGVWSGLHYTYTKELIRKKVIIMEDKIRTTISKDL